MPGMCGKAVSAASQYAGKRSSAPGRLFLAERFSTLASRTRHEHTYSGVKYSPASPYVSRM